jgi:mannose-1-phosphate guanylyltransferase/mannose-6-phosphate isomerase
LRLHPVILCGGPGARLWPASTRDRPKPFLDLLEGLSLFQRTVLRMAALPDAAAPIVVAGAAHCAEAQRQLAQIGQSVGLLIEPEGRDSGPAVIAAALHVARAHPEGVIVCVASDHHIADEAAFADGVVAAAPAARDGAIVTFGIRPHAPSPAFGYIRPGEPLDAGSPILEVERFEEKPTPARAETLVLDGCLWNSGNFVFRADTMIAEAADFDPRLVAAATSALDQASACDGVVVLGPAFLDSPRTSIDVAVMERTRRAAVLPIAYGWSDLGSWQAVWAASAKDSQENAAHGAVTLQSAEGCLVRAEPGVNVLALGVRNLAVIASPGAVLVCDLAHSSRVRPPAAVAAPPQADDASADLRRAAERLRDWLWGSALPLWWCFGADHQGGGFHERLRWDRSPTGHDRRAQVQARQVFVYATAGAMAWPGPWRAAVTHGLAGLAARFRRADGLYRGVVSAQGLPIDDRARLSDQALVLLAQAAAAAAAPELASALRDEAEALATAATGAFAAPGGGLRAHEDGSAHLSGPVMRLLEAALAWAEVDASPAWRDLADRVADHALERMLDDEGRMPEAFDPDWRPAESAEGRRIIPGRQFAWASRLERWARLTDEARGHEAATRLYAVGAMTEAEPGFGSSRLWPQAERLEAALRLETDPDRRARESLSAVAAMERHFTDEPRGLWRDTLSPAAQASEEAALASTFYHIAGAIAALTRQTRAPWSEPRGVD